MPGLAGLLAATELVCLWTVGCAPVIGINLLFGQDISLHASDSEGRIGCRLSIGFPGRKNTSLFVR